MAEINFADDPIAAGLTPDPADSAASYVSRVDVIGGRVDITFGGPGAHAEIVGNVLSLTPYQTGPDSIVWRCGNAQAPNAGARITGGAAHTETTVAARYLPAKCRK